MNGWKHYVNAANYGQTKWYHWVGGFWFVFIGWILAQSILTTPIMPLIEKADPELSNQLTAATLAIFDGVDMDDFIKKSLGFLAAGILATGFWVGLRAVSHENKAKTFGIIALLNTGLAFYFAHQLAPYLSHADSTKLLTQSMALNPIIYMCFLTTFPGTLAIVYLIQKFWHSRTIKSLHTAFDRFNWKRVFFAMGVFWAIAAIFSIIGHFSGHSTLTLQFDPARFFGFALVSFLFIPLQSATEEIIVRGYMNQGLGQYIKSPWVVFFLTSLLFMALHLSNPEASASADKGAYMHVLTMSSYFSFGFLLCILVYYEGGLETAIGVHAANNLFAAVFVNYENSVLPTPSVYITQLNPAYDLPIGMVMLAIVTYILVRTRSAHLKAQTLAPLASV